MTLSGIFLPVIAIVVIGLCGSCLTTAVGQTTAAADYFVTLSGNRFHFQWTVAGCCIVSALIALIGVDNIVKFSNPLYLAIYPVILVLLVLGIFSKMIPNDGGYKGAVAFTVVYSICEALLSIGIPMTGLQKIVSAVPFSAEGFGWFIPSVVGFSIGAVLYPSITKRQSLQDRMVIYLHKGNKRSSTAPPKIRPHPGEQTDKKHPPLAGV